MKIRNIIRSRVLQTIAAGLAIHITASYTGLPREFLNAFAIGISLTLAASVIVVYLPVAWPSLLAPQLTSKDRIAWGIVFSWFARTVLSGVALYGLARGKPTNFNETFWSGLVFTIVCIAAFFHIMAPHQEEVRPHYNWPLLLMSLVLGSLICGTILGLGLAHSGFGPF